MFSWRNKGEAYDFRVQRLFVRVFLTGTIVFVPTAIGVGIGIAMTDPGPAILWFSSAAASAVIALFLWDEITKLKQLHRWSFTAIGVFAVLFSVWEGDSWVVNKVEENSRKEILRIINEANLLRKSQAGSQKPKFDSPEPPPIAVPQKTRKVVAPELDAEFINPRSLDIQLINHSKGLVKDPKYHILFFDLDRDLTRSLPVNVLAAAGDYIKPKDGMGPFQALSEQAIALVKQGDRLLGHTIIFCSNCGYDRHY